MDNDFSEKVHVGIRRERQKNGDIYVFENKCHRAAKMAEKQACILAA